MFPLSLVASSTSHDDSVARVAYRLPPRSAASSTWRRYYGIFASNDGKGSLMRSDNPRNKEDIYKSKLEWAPGLRDVLRQVRVPPC